MSDVALVTDASSELGEAIALRLAAGGYELALHTRAGVEELVFLCEKARARGVRALAVRADLADEAAVKRMVSEAERALGPLTLVVNNGGVVREHEAPGLATPDGSIAEANLRAALHVCRAVVEGMRRRRRGRIINVCSVACELAAVGR